MTPDERQEYERSLAETTRLIEEQMAYLRQRSAERRERQEKWEHSLLGRLSRRLGLAE